LADNVTLQSSTLASPASGTVFATDDVSSAHYPYGKVVFGADGTATIVTASVGLPTNLVQVGGSSVTAGAGAVAAGTPRVTLASDDPAVVALQILDNIVSGSEAQVDIVGALPTGSNVIGAVTQSGTWNVGTVTTVSAVTSITNTVTVTGAGGTFPVTDSGGSLTVDAPVGTPVFVRLSDGASAITTLAVSLASVPSHAVTNAGTFVVQVDGTALTRLTDIKTNTDSLAVVGNGAAATAVRVTLANDSTGVIATVGAVTSITNTVTVTGTAAVTNAGTFVVQENGAALTALQVIDDWDESDRCKTNPIVGQAGVAGGNGTVGATTQRVARALASSATLANVAASASSVTLQASNSGRIGLAIYNDSTSALYVKLGATASATSFTVKVPSYGYYEMPEPVYTGVVDGIWDAATGSARMTEVA
jgi:hypothetical protein